VLGYARIAREQVMPAIQRAANAELAAVASRSEAKLAECQARYPGVRTCLGYEEFLRDPSIDAVYLPLPNAQHCEWTIKAAEQGKHILCEKPLALNAGEVTRMTDACAAHGVVLMEAFMYRYTDRIRQVLAVLRSGELGDVKFVSASFRFLLNNPASIKLRPELGGGSLYDVGCYPVNFAGLVADTIAGGGPGSSRPESVAVECVKAGGIDQMFSALLRYPGGLVAAVHCGFNLHRRVGAEIVGTRGLLTVPDPFFDNPGAIALTTDAGTREIAVAESDRYRSEIEDFAAAVTEGRPPQLGLAESLRNAELIDRLLAAASP